MEKVYFSNTSNVPMNRNCGYYEVVNGVIQESSPKDYLCVNDRYVPAWVSMKNTSIVITLSGLIEHSDLCFYRYPDYLCVKDFISHFDTVLRVTDEVAEFVTFILEEVNKTSSLKEGRCRKFTIELMSKMGFEVYQVGGGFCFHRRLGEWEITSLSFRDVENIPAVLPLVVNRSD